METGVQQVQYLHQKAVIAGQRVKRLVGVIHSDNYDLQEKRREVQDLVRFYGSNAKELKECVREVLMMSEVFTHLSQFEAWNARDVFALLQALAGILCYRRNEDNIRQACQALIELPLMLSPKDLDHVVSRFNKFPEILAHRLGQVVTYECQMELLRASLNMGNTKNLITEERRNKLNLLNPGSITKSNKLFTSITPDNHMKATRAYLNHYNTSIVAHNGIKSMEARILAFNGVEISDDGHPAFINFNSRDSDSSISILFTSKLLLPRDPGNLLVEMKSCSVIIVGDEGRPSILVSSALWTIHEDNGQDISDIFGDIGTLKVQLCLSDMGGLQRSILCNYQGNQAMDIEFTFGTEVTPWEPSRIILSQTQQGPGANPGTTTRSQDVTEVNTAISISSEGTIVLSQPRPDPQASDGTHSQELSDQDDGDYEEEQGSGSEQEDESDPEVDNEHDWMDDGGQATTSRTGPRVKKPLFGQKAALITILRSLKRQGQPDPTVEQLVPLMTQEMKTTVSAFKIKKLIEHVRSTDATCHLSLAQRFETLRNEKPKVCKNPVKSANQMLRYHERDASGFCKYSTCRLPRMPGQIICENHVATYAKVLARKNQKRRDNYIIRGWDELTKLYNNQRVYNAVPGEKNPISTYQDQVKQFTKDLLGKLGPKPTDTIYQVYVGLTDQLAHRLQEHKVSKPHMDKNVHIVVPSALFAGFVEIDCGFKLQAMFGARCENVPVRLGQFGQSAPSDKQYHVYILYNQA